jgi:hypothetical protein
LNGSLGLAGSLFEALVRTVFMLAVGIGSKFCGLQFVRSVVWHRVLLLAVGIGSKFCGLKFVRSVGWHRVILMVVAVG